MWRKLLKTTIRRVYQTDGSPIVGIRRPRKLEAKPLRRL
jgi:hypothetical protein